MSCGKRADPPLNEQSVGEVLLALAKRPKRDGDVTFKLAERKEVYVDRELLAARCEKFAGMFRGGAQWKEAKENAVDAPHVELAVFETFRKYLLCDALDADTDPLHLSKVGALAGEYLFGRLAKACKEAIARRAAQCADPFELLKAARANGAALAAEAIWEHLTSKMRNEEAVTKVCRVKYRAFDTDCDEVAATQVVLTTGGASAELPPDFCEWATAEDLEACLKGEPICCAHPDRRFATVVDWLKRNDGADRQRFLSLVPLFYVPVDVVLKDDFLSDSEKLGALKDGHARFFELLARSP